MRDDNSTTFDKQDANDQLAIRRAKLAQLRQQQNAYPNRLFHTFFIF